ncbi:hypothetical protein GY45DRAFT_1371686 [Cubamyces sp. BRFM 1775]|nr:hypothetical protein GY45DRAFT_1371686 [Cubamyces sp. BRFM 1775]
MSEERLTSIGSLHIGTAPQADARWHSAAASGSGVLAFLGNVPVQVKEDVLYSTLYAQLESDKKYPGRPIEKMEEWLKEYVSVLLNVGWIFPDSKRDIVPTEISDAREYKSVDKLIMEAERPHLTGDVEPALFRKMIKSLRERWNAGALWAIDMKAVHGYDASFQVGVVSLDGGKAQLKLGMHHYKMSEEVNEALLRTLAVSQLKYMAGEGVMKLDDRVYANLRSMVRRRVWSEAQAFVKEIRM